MRGRDRLLTEQQNPASASIDTLPTEDMLRVINAEDQKVAAAVGLVIPAIARAVDAAVHALENGGRLFYVGGGEPALSRATETTEDDPAIGKRDLLARGFTASDVLVGIAASGRTPYVL